MAIDLIREFGGKRGIEIWREEYPDAQLVFAGEDMKDFNLSGADCSGADAEGAILTGAYLQGSKWEGASLKGAILLHAHIENMNIVGLRDMEETDWSQTVGAPVATRPQMEVIGAQRSRYLARCAVDARNGASLQYHAGVKRYSDTTDSNGGNSTVKR